MEGKTLGFSHRFKVVQYVCTNLNQKGLQRTAKEYAEERRNYKDLISKNDK